MVFILPLASLLFIMLWIIAEFENSRWILRVSLGLLTLVTVAMSMSYIARFGPGIESGTTRSSLRLAEQLMIQGKTQRVQRSIHAYNVVAASGSTYRASFELWDVLNHSPETTTVGKPDAAPPPAAAAGN